MSDTRLFIIDSSFHARVPIHKGMKYYLVFALFCLSSCGARITVLPATLEAARASVQREAEAALAEEGALTKPVPKASVAAAESSGVSAVSGNVKLVSASLDPVKERVSVVIDAPVGSEVTYRLDGDDPIAVGPSFDIDDFSAREHVLEVTVYVPGGGPKVFRLEWAENTVVPKLKSRKHPR